MLLDIYGEAKKISFSKRDEKVYDIYNHNQRAFRMIELPKVE